MGEPHVVSALREKRAEISGVIVELERRIALHRADLVHLDANLAPVRPGAGAGEHRAEEAAGGALPLFRHRRVGAPQPGGAAHGGGAHRCR